MNINDEKTGLSVTLGKQEIAYPVTIEKNGKKVTGWYYPGLNHFIEIDGADEYVDPLDDLHFSDETADLIDDEGGIKEYVEELVANNIGKKMSFPITSVCRDDFKSQGFNATSLTDEDMKEIADKLQDALVGDSYWQVISEYAEEKELPQLEQKEEAAA